MSHRDTFTFTSKLYFPISYFICVCEFLISPWHSTSLNRGIRESKICAAETEIFRIGSRDITQQSGTSVRVTKPRNNYVTL
jgi:hypothetical protein